VFAALALQTATDSEVRVHVPGVVYVIAAVVAVGLAAYLLGARRRGGARDRAIARLASGHGWRYSSADPAGLGEMRFRSFAGSKHALVTNVVTTDGGRGAVRAFDYALMFERAYESDRPLSLALADEVFGMDGEPTGRVAHTYTKRRTGAVARIDAFLPALAATPASLVTRAFEGVGVSDHDFESVEFNRQWDVRCGDERFAWLFCDSSMIDLILELGRGVSVETFGNYVVFTRELLAEPDDVMRFVDLVAQVPSILNPLIVEEYPTVAAMESKAMIDDWAHRPDGKSGVF
jgi:hypothetical protein